MGWTYATLSQAIKDWVQTDETTFNTNIPIFIQNAEERILYAADLEVFRKNQTGTLTAGQKYLAVPSDYLSAFSLSVTANNTQTFLLQKDPEYLQEYNPTNAQGIPKYYGIFDVDNFILAPVPNNNYPVEIHYYHRPPSIVTTSPTWLGDYAQEALFYGSLVEAYIFLKGDQDLLQAYSQRFGEAIDRLKNYGEGRENIDTYRDGLIRKQAT